MKFLLERPVKQPVLDSLFNYLTKRVLMGVPSSQLTTNFSAKNQLTTIFLANSQLTPNSSYLSTFTFLQRILFRHNPNFLYFCRSKLTHNVTKAQFFRLLRGHFQVQVKYKIIVSLYLLIVRYLIILILYFTLT